MTNTPITPAMTPQEWDEWNRTQSLHRPVPMTPEEVAMHGQRYTGVSFGWPWSGLVVNAEHSCAGLDRTFTHAAAALCLHNQPFGFTRDDVDVLVDAMDTYGIPVASLIERISALLPPEL